jgi:hypothetical protein
MFSYSLLTYLKGSWKPQEERTIEPQDLKDEAAKKAAGGK